MNTPNWTLNLPAKPYEGSDPDGFMAKLDFIKYLTNYAKDQNIPIKPNVEVTHAKFSERHWHLRTSGGTTRARALIVATSTYQYPHIPACSHFASTALFSVNAANYRKPDALPPGKILVVGSAQSGVQIVDDLLNAGRDVILSTGTAGRVPRRYRGRDLNYWYDKTGLMDRKASDLQDPRQRWSGQPQISGWNGGHTISLQKFYRNGVRLLGRFAGYDGHIMYFKQDLRQNMAAADRHSKTFCRNIDDYIASKNLKFPADTGDDPIHNPIKDLSVISEPSRIIPTDEGISTIIWTTGFRFDYSWIEANSFDKFGYPNTNRGEASVPGLYFLGMNYLHTRKSGIVYGITDDAKHVAARICDYLKNN